MSVKIDTIVYGNAEEGQPLKWFRIGWRGCISIDEIESGNKVEVGMKRYWYRVNFENASSLEIKDTAGVWGETP